MMGFCKTTRFNGMEAAQISLNELKAADKAISEILSCAQQLVEGAKQAAKQGGSFDSLERDIWSKVRQIGFAAMELFIRLRADKWDWSKFADRGGYRTITRKDGAVASR